MHRTPTCTALLVYNAQFTHRGHWIQAGSLPWGKAYGSFKGFNNGISWRSGIAPGTDLAALSCQDLGQNCTQEEKCYVLGSMIYYAEFGFELNAALDTLTQAEQDAVIYGSITTDINLIQIKTPGIHTELMKHFGITYANKLVLKESTETTPGYTWQTWQVAHSSS